MVIYAHKFTGKSMKVLYGINGIGNGHMSRARIMVPKLEAAGAEVSCIISGRPADPSLAFGQSGDVMFRDGLSIAFDAGKVKFFETALRLGAGLPGLARDAMTLNLKPYDLVISDFEPVSAWAARARGTPSVGLAHHFAFRQDVPKVSRFSPFMMFMENVVPVDTALGLHWHHFGQPSILPPILGKLEAEPTDPNKILVYMNFENLASVINLVEPFADHDFYIYSSQAKRAEDKGHVHIRPLSREGFKKDFASCAGVISNAGFMTTSEALQLGKKVLVKAVPGQEEQVSNTLALKKLGYGAVMDRLDRGAVKGWLARNDFARVCYPDTAQAVTDWIMKGDWRDTGALTRACWAQVQYPSAAAPV